MGLPASDACHARCRLLTDVGLNPLSPLAKPVRSLPCKYVVQSGDDVPVVTPKAAEVAAREGDTMLRVAAARIGTMPSAT